MPIREGVYSWTLCKHYSLQKLWVHEQIGPKIFGSKEVKKNFVFFGGFVLKLFFWNCMKWTGTTLKMFDLLQSFLLEWKLWIWWWCRKQASLQIERRFPPSKCTMTISMEENTLSHWFILFDLSLFYIQYVYSTLL